MRKPLAVIDAAPTKLTECTECAKCCTYVAVGINPPSRARWATDILWYLYHENISVYRDGEGEWMVQFETRCRHLAYDKLCRIYPHRPHICRSFDNRTCEVNDPGGGRLFTDPDDFLDYLKGQHPRLHRFISKQHVVPKAKAPRARSAARAR
jgi:Fe-S-cluster containining protein